MRHFHDHLNSQNNASQAEPSLLGDSLRSACIHNQRTHSPAASMPWRGFDCPPADFDLIFMFVPNSVWTQLSTKGLFNKSSFATSYPHFKQKKNRNFKQHNLKVNTSIHWLFKRTSGSIFTIINQEIAHALLPVIQWATLYSLHVFLLSVTLMDIMIHDVRKLFGDLLVHWDL